MSDPAAISWESNRLSVAVLGTAGKIDYRYNIDGTWVFQDMGGAPGGPGGQIEDLGTTFVTCPRSPHAEISVNEGRVMFRHGGDAPLSWPAAADGASTSLPQSACHCRSLGRSPTVSVARTGSPRDGHGARKR